MKKIVFVCSTAFSGSTMLDLMLANGEDGFSCGEVTALFRPWREHHIHPLCGCRNPECEVWGKLKNYGEEGFFPGIFTAFPNVNHVIDSSKHLSWLNDQNQYLKNYDFEVITILLWKDPLEFAYSLWKRGRSLKWEDIWLRYYSTAFSISDKWVSVPYRDLATHPKETCKGLCEKIGIPYFEGKELFWNGTYHTLFGSDSVKAHLIDRDSQEFHKLMDKRSKSKPNIDRQEISEFKNHRKFYYDATYLDKLPITIRRNVQYKDKLEQIKSILQKTDFRKTPENTVYQKAKDIHKSPFWYPREKTLQWLLWQKTKLEMLSGIRTFRSANADGG